MSTVHGGRETQFHLVGSEDLRFRGSTRDAHPLVDIAEMPFPTKRELDRQGNSSPVNARSSADHIMIARNERQFLLMNSLVCWRL